MTSNLAIHLIEQFAAQAPFGLWVTDSRGVVIFANKKLHEMLEIPDHPSKALGVSLFDDHALEELRLSDAARRAKSGEVVDVVTAIEAPDRLGSQIPIGRKEPLTVKINCYPLRSSTQRIEHYVIVMSDVSETYSQREKLRQHLRDLTIFNKSRDARLSRLSELQEEARALEAEIRSRGATPVDGTDAAEESKAP